MSPKANEELQESAASAATLAGFRAAAAEDLRALALLHDRELDAERIRSLWEHCDQDFLGVRLQGDRGREAMALFRDGLTDLPAALPEKSLDQLAADYADIYLTYGLRASPYESVWLDADNLAMQLPMFQVRQWYRRHGFAVADWRKRSDDHLVCELHFLAQLLDPETAPPIDLAEAARFMDEHPLRWVEQFAARVARRCTTRLYAGLALLTAAYLGELRDLLAHLAAPAYPAADDASRNTPSDRLAEPNPRRGSPEQADAAAVGPYLPGLAPGW